MTKYQKMMEEAAKYVAKANPILVNPWDVADFMRPIVQGEMQETLYAIYVTCRGEVIEFRAITKGLVTKTAVHSREVFRDAITLNAVALIMVHNHPSGDPNPSPADISCTRELWEAGKILGIALQDHIIIGHKTDKRPIDYISMKEMGYI